jgi:D-serine deaminase-like pyridoxal phosphate-dependent protein
VGDVPGAGLHVRDLPLPVLTLRLTALEHNIEAMAAWCSMRGAGLAPHGKTTMAPQLFARQLEADAWGITVATIQQARVAASVGVRRILIANQVLAHQDFAWVAEHAARDDRNDALFLVDSVESVALADEAASRAAGPLRVLLEVGYPGGRAGVRDLASALASADAADRAPHVELVGVEGYEGLLSDVSHVDRFLDRLATVASELGPIAILSAGGSAYFDRVEHTLGPLARELGATLILRPGCYVTHDHGKYERTAPAARGIAGAPDLRPAIDVRARVLSRPEPTRAILGLGKRDVAYDVDPPMLRDLPGHVVALDDQHAHVQLRSETRCAPGDLVTCGISHPCTALERWRVIPVVDDGGQVVEAVATMF